MYDGWVEDTMEESNKDTVCTFEFWSDEKLHKNIFKQLKLVSDAKNLVSGVFELKNKYGFEAHVLTALPYLIQQFFKKVVDT